MDLHLNFEDNDTAHKDIVLKFAGGTWTCDSYYFALDRELIAQKEDAIKAKAVIKRLLEQWLSAIDGLRKGSEVFLPYDFSDQYTAWLHCKWLGNEVRVSRGWSTIEGWSFSPSNIGKYIHELPSFKEIGPSVEVEHSELLTAISASIEKIS